MHKAFLSCSSFFASMGCRGWQLTTADWESIFTHTYNSVYAFYFSMWDKLISFVSALEKYIKHIWSGRRRKSLYYLCFHKASYPLQWRLIFSNGVLQVFKLALCGANFSVGLWNLPGMKISIFSHSVTFFKDYSFFLGNLSLYSGERQF